MIDSHQHFWRYDPGLYAWIGDEMGALKRDFLPTDLMPLIAASGIEGVIAVQARQDLAETEWLLELAGQHAFIRGVVGWAPLIDPQIKTTLARMKLNPKLKGIRHVLQGEPDPAYMLRPDFNRGVAYLTELDLTYDILIYERHLPQACEFVAKHPRQRFVLDHVAKPRIREKILSPWREQIRQLSRFENVWCKISGMVTEADPKAWTVDELRPYAETVLEAFGPRRLLFGSDWPVCLLGVTYDRWVRVVGEFTQKLSAREKELVFRENAVAAYRLE